MTDRTRVERAVDEIIRALGEDPHREGLEGTPSRVAEMYSEIFGGLALDPTEVLTGGFEEGYDEMVIARDIPFHSMCEHHLLPFFGVAHIGYLPKGRVAGISKLARVVNILSRRPQMQERMTAQIADTLLAGLEPQGVGVVIEAQHLCMVMRGLKTPGSTIVTSVNRGIFRSDTRTRMEFLALIGRPPG